MRIQAHCPAKLNLFLSVGAPDRRGYHPLRTIFQAVGLFDVLTATIVDYECSPTIEKIGFDLPEENTLTKAYRLSREIFDVHVQHIRLQKRIPAEAGLGGGSSDAAGLLRIMNSVKPAAPGELSAVAAAVGADVPFFLHGGRARGTRYGDRIEPLPDEPTRWFLILKPEVGCSTPEMFRALDAKGREWRDWPSDGKFYNDFERVAPCECLELVERLLSAGASDAALSGSGSAVFGEFGCRADAEEAAVRIGMMGWVVPSASRAESLRLNLGPDITTWEERIKTNHIRE